MSAPRGPLHTAVANDGQIVALLALAAGIEVSCFEPHLQLRSVFREDGFRDKSAPGQQVYSNMSTEGLNWEAV